MLYDSKKGENSELNNNFVFDDNGICGYRRKVNGADTVIPFKSVEIETKLRDKAATISPYPVSLTFPIDTFVGEELTLLVTSVSSSYHNIDTFTTTCNVTGATCYPSPGTYTCNVGSANQRIYNLVATNSMVSFEIIADSSSEREEICALLIRNKTYTS